MQRTILGVDLGGTKILVGEISLTNQLLHHRRFDTDVTSQENALQRIKECLHVYLQEEPLLGSVSQLSVAVVGRVDPATGTWFEIHPGNSQQMDLKAALLKEFQLPVVITNDVSAAAVAESRYGIGKRTSDFCYLNVGTGIAGRIVNNGKIMRGGHFNAGEIGHTVLSMGEEPLCTCGRYGCVEAFASGLGMSNECHRLKGKLATTLSINTGERVRTEALIQGYQADDPLASAIIRRAAQGIAELIMNLVRASDPEAVIVGGGVMSDPTMFQLVQEKLNPRTMRFVTYGVQQTDFDPSFITLMGCGALGISALEGGRVNERSVV